MDVVRDTVQGGRRPLMMDAVASHVRQEYRDRIALALGFVTNAIRPVRVAIFKVMKRLGYAPIPAERSGEGPGVSAI
jgi:hypothetical protein